MSDGREGTLARSHALLVGQHRSHGDKSSGRLYSPNRRESGKVHWRLQFRTARDRGRATRYISARMWRPTMWGWRGRIGGWLTGCFIALIASMAPVASGA